MGKEVMIPLELKHDFAIRGYTSMLRGFLYVIRERHGAAEALKCMERFFKMEDRVKNLTNTLLAAFKIEGNDAETIGKLWDIWWELCGYEGSVLERSKTIARSKVTKCPWRTKPKDISDWDLTWFNITAKTINPKAIIERPRAMCAGDSYCEFIAKIDE